MHDLFVYIQKQYTNVPRLERHSVHYCNYYARNEIDTSTNDSVREAISRISNSLRE